MSDESLDLVTDAIVYIDGLEYCTLQKEHVKEANDLLCRAFTTYNEPAASHVPYESGAWQRFVDYYLQKTVKDTMSHVCVDRRTGKVVGIVCTNDYLDLEDESFVKDLSDKWGDWFPQIFHLCELVDGKFVAERKAVDEMKLGVIWHMWMAAVDKDYGRRGVATTLFEISLREACRRGYKYAVAECTNVYSLKPFQKNGCYEHTTLEYGTFEFPPDSGKYPMKQFEKQPGFDRIVLAVKDLAPCRGR
jgi:ribosomal protein S18 acetylase RimI-like enzyme